MLVVQSETVVEDVSAVEEWLVDQIGSEAVAALLAPALVVVAILLVAFLIHLAIRRLINRAVEAAKVPDGTLKALRVKTGRHIAEERFARRVQRFDALGSVGRSAAGVVIWGIAIMIALSATGLPIGPLIASAGIVGVAIGFGAQDLVKDIISGAFMLVEDQYGVGDIIDVGEAIGVVEDIGLRSTEIRGLDGTLWHVPNGEIRRVGNMSQEFSRILLDIGIAYGADIDHALEVIEQTMVEFAAREEEAPLFLADPEIYGVESLGDSAVTIRVVADIMPGEQWMMQRRLRREIKYALDEAGIEIPFPQHTVWMRQEE